MCIYEKTIFWGCTAWAISYEKYDKVFLFFNNSLAVGQHAKPILTTVWQRVSMPSQSRWLYKNLKFLNSMRFFKFVHAF